MTAAAIAPRPIAGREPASTTRLLVITLIAVGAVLAMHGLGPHHADLLMDSAPIPPVAMAPMAADTEAHDDGGSPHHQHAPAAPHDLVALCAVIVLAAMTLVTRRLASTRHECWSPRRLHEFGTRPEPPVPRLVLAFN